MDIEIKSIGKRKWMTTKLSSNWEVSIEKSSLGGVYLWGKQDQTHCFAHYDEKETQDLITALETDLISSLEFGELSVKVTASERDTLVKAISETMKA